jgi:tRNA pseudouridine55 synthase
LGEATKLLNFMELDPKTYQGTLRFGLETDTWDITGAVLAKKPVSPMSTRFLSRTLARQVGERFLFPPVYSAIKHRGKPLYAYARQGKPVETVPRRTFIHSFFLLENRGTDLDFELVCSRGTYVRSLVQSLGKELGYGACLVSLRRLRCGRFRIAHARKLTQMEELLEKGRGADALLPPEQVIGHVPACNVEGENAIRVRHGNTLRGSAVNGLDFRGDCEGKKVRIMAHGRLIAVAEIRRDDGGFYLQPVRVLNHGS